MKFISQIFLVVLVGCGLLATPAQAKSVLQDIEKSLKNIDRQLCANARSGKCKIKQTHAKHKTKPKTNVAAPPVNPPAVVHPAKIKSTPPPVVPPMPKLRPTNFNPAKPPEPSAPAPALKPTPVVPPPLVEKPVAPIVVVPPKLSAPPIDQAQGCLSALAGIGASFAPVPQPETSAACQVDTPVRLNSLTTKMGVIKLPDLPIVNCAFAIKLSQFVDQHMQPLAQQNMGSAVVAMGTGPGFNCRGRNGDSGGKMSEHAIGNAIDIETIKLANKAQVMVKDALSTQSPNFAFLRDLRAAACLDFTTVLGPGANAAHAEHFHIDLEVRRGGYRLCE